MSPDKGRCRRDAIIDLILRKSRSAFSKLASRNWGRHEICSEEREESCVTTLL
jgi:hypothetical protein